MGSSVPVDANSGEPKGFRQHKPLVVTKERGAASPQILQAHWRNRVLPEVVLEIVGRSEDGAKRSSKSALRSRTHRRRCRPLLALLSESHRRLRRGLPRGHRVPLPSDMVENPAAGTSTSDDWNEPGS